MKKRIYISFFILVLLCVLLLTASVSIIVYNATRLREINSIKDRANLVAEILNNAVEQDLQFNFSYYDPDAARITIIAYDGTVLLDNKANPAALENHSNRVEFRDALENGRGESMRFSETIDKDTYYYAIRLNNGNVLRISKTVERISGVFTDVLLSMTGITIVVLILAAILAGRLTKSIVNPLNDIDFDTDNFDVYDELVPFIRKINRQKSEIANQVDMLHKRDDTIDVIINNMKEGLILINNTGSILSINKSASEILGGDNLAGMNVLHVNRDIDFQKGVDKCLNGINSEIIYQRSGKIFNVYFSPVYDYEITGGVILFCSIPEKIKHNAM